MATPREIHGHRLNVWNRLRYRIGFVPFRRCPGQHRIRNIYGDEIIAAGGRRSRCIDCEKFWPGLFPKEGNSIGEWVESDSERQANVVNEIGDGK